MARTGRKPTHPSRCPNNVSRSLPTWTALLACEYMSELTALAATRLAQLVNGREVTAIEVVEAHLKRADELNPKINAITDLQAESALEQASRVDEDVRLGRPRDSLAGVPVTVKSSIAVKGFRQECGTSLRLGEVAEADAPLVADLKDAGAIVLGTTNVPEFLMAYETDNALYGRTRSPLNLDFTPGGSSGGCSAAVAGQISAGSIGSDAGGSVRVPAHFCGLYGFKPTPGMIPRTGHWPAVAGPSVLLAGIGPLARTADDLALMTELTRSSTSDDISCVLEFDPPWHDPSVIRGVRVGWFDHAWDTPVTAETRAAIATAVAAMREHGFQMERIDPVGLERAPGVWRLMFGKCLRTLIEGSVPEGYRLHPLAYEAMAPDAELGETTYEELLRGWVAQDQLRDRFRKLMDRYTFLLCPVASIPAFRHGERRWMIDGEAVTYPEAFVYSQVFNVLGAPAATIPVSTSSEGLPIGVQLVGLPYSDRSVTTAVLEMAAALGQA